jgi:hypothetical protein
MWGVAAAALIIGLMVGAAIAFVGIAVGREMGRRESDYYE